MFFHRLAAITRPGGESACAAVLLVWFGTT
jgi:hypothetical protein